MPHGTLSPICYPQNPRRWIKEEMEWKDSKPDAKKGYQPSTPFIMTRPPKLLGQPTPEIQTGLLGKKPGLFERLMVGQLLTLLALSDGLQYYDKAMLGSGVGSFDKKNEQALRMGVWYSVTRFVSIFSPLVDYGVGRIAPGGLESWQ
ncbi:hypothetical protein CLAIMM_14225 [Cladophialophora immunda]|nr:hypothetical protein CLAIMM_14225 [Cladophialophora immunda]